MRRTTFLLAMFLVACGQAEVPAEAPGAAAAPRVPKPPPSPALVAPAARLPAEYARAIVAQAGPACRTFLRCCEDTAARMPGVPVDCAQVAARGERTCEQALANYTRLPAELQSRMPATCTGGVQP